MAKITIDDLAKMVKNGFYGVDEKLEKLATKEQVNSLDTRLGAVEKDVKYIKENLDDVGKLGKRVDYIEGAMNISALHAKKI